MQGLDAIQSSHDISSFDCGNPLLNDWLKRRALANHSGGATRCYVVTQANAVVAYYAMSAGAVAASQATGNVKRNMPDPIPVMVLARLAVDRRAQGIHLGASLLLDAVDRAIAVSQQAGVRALLVHALHERAKHFYEHHGFQVSPANSMTLMLRLSSVNA